ncbi:hypothetical protein BU15DRAFT_61176 [Melanogaster broomeanus]|nr:hypothetical protein BU15DRAFT_61176 [Melanogaster broomeanus]
MRGKRNDRTLRIRCVIAGDERVSSIGTLEDKYSNLSYQGSILDLFLMPYAAAPMEQAFFKHAPRTKKDLPAIWCSARALLCLLKKDLLIVLPYMAQLLPQAEGGKLLAPTRVPTVTQPSKRSRNVAVRGAAVVLVPVDPSSIRFPLNNLVDHMERKTSMDFGKMQVNNEVGSRGRFRQKGLSARNEQKRFRWHRCGAPYCARGRNEMTVRFAVFLGRLLRYVVSALRWSKQTRFPHDLRYIDLLWNEVEARGHFEQKRFRCAARACTLGQNGNVYPCKSEACELCEMIRACFQPHLERKREIASKSSGIRLGADLYYPSIFKDSFFVREYSDRSEAAANTWSQLQDQNDAYAMSSSESHTTRSSKTQCPGACRI